MLHEFLQTTPVNTQEKQDTHGKQLVSDCCDNQTRTDASMLVWRILFRSCIVACMLHEFLQTTLREHQEKMTRTAYGSLAITATIGPGPMFWCASGEFYFGRL
jgi:hypothetical protein